MTRARGAQAAAPLYTCLATPPDRQRRLALLDARRSKDARWHILFQIDHWLLLWQTQQPKFLDGRRLKRLQLAAAELAAGLASEVDDLARFSGTNADELRGLRRASDAFAVQLDAALADPDNRAPDKRQGQRTDPRVDSLLQYLRSGWNRATGYYPSASPTSEFVRLVCDLADDPAWGRAGLPYLSPKMIEKRTSRKGIFPGSRQVKEKLPPTSKRRQAKSGK